MKVSIITPTTESRDHFSDRIKNIFLAQDYDNVEWICVGDDYSVSWRRNLGMKCDTHDIWHEELTLASKTIGAKLNAACDLAHGEIILRMDDDDLYAPDWISKSVAALTSSSADCVGLSTANFYRTADKQLFQFSNKPNTQLFLCGATLCFYKKTWEKTPFPDSSLGEDRDWQVNIKRAAHNYTDGFLATIHGANTCSHKSLPLMKKAAPEEAARVLRLFS